MRKVIGWSLVGFLLASVSLLAQQNALTPAATATGSSATEGHFSSNVPTFSQRYPRYRLCASDSFDVVFEYTPEWNQTVMVQPDGYITLRSVGDLYVNGLSVEDTRNKIADAYNKILNKPAISIALRDFQKPYFIADGLVNRPGKYELRGDTTAIQAIAMAGGFNSQYAKHSHVIIFRRVDDNWVETKVLDVKAMENSGNLAEDVHLQPGDMIFVPKNTLSKLQQWIPVYSVNMMAARTQSF